MERTVASWLGVSLPEQLSFFIKSGLFLLASWSILYVLPRRQLPGGTRHAAQFPSRAGRGSLSLKTFPALWRSSFFSAHPSGPKSSISISKLLAFGVSLSLFDPATLTLLVTGADGRPVAHGSLAIRLDAPKPGRFFSTDFPFVEGSRLLEMTLPLRQGKAEWKYLFPIRGDYLLAVDFVAPDGRKASKTFAFRIRESKQKWILLGGFSLTLFAFGAIAGRVFTGRPRTNDIATGLLFSMGSLLLSPGIAPAQGAESARYFGWLEVDPATVGKPSSVRWRLGGDEQTEKSTALAYADIAHPEKDKIVLRLSDFPWWGVRDEFQFTDGAEY